jgi:type 1 glutamine amidotransferase
MRKNNWLLLALLTSITLAAWLGGTALLGQNPPADPEAGNGVKPIRALLVTGGCCHDYERQKKILAEGISARANVEWTIVHEGEGEKKGGTRHQVSIYKQADWAKGYDVVVHDECFADVRDEQFIEGILKPHRDGVPAVMLHCAMHSYRSKGYPQKTPWFELTGCPSTSHGPQAPIAISFEDKQSPITRGMADWTTINEELYNNSAGKLLDTARPLARGKQTYRQRGAERTDEAVVAWTNTYAGKTRVFATTLGHNNSTVADGRYLDLVTRGLLWATDKLNEQGRPKGGYGPKK